MKAMNNVLLAALSMALLAACQQQPMADVKAVTEVTASEPVFAEVVTVTPLSEPRTVSREACEDQVVERRRAERFGDKDGAVVGAVVGGLLGNQVGSGSGRRAATVAGAVGGALAGREIDRRHQGGQRYTDVETVCRDVAETTDQVVGYTVQVRHASGEIEELRVDQAPAGPKIEVGSREVVVGYEVQWVLGERSGTVQMKDKPGERIPLEALLPVAEAPPASG
jgi:uncharacterized protein YcfJ